MSQKLGVITPVRDREEHLSQFIPHMKKFLKGYNVNFYVIEQTAGGLFNKGRLYNAAFQLWHKEVDYICFHDVDMLPLFADYAPPKFPTHLASMVEQFNYTVPYPNYFGGVTLFKPEDYIAVNGFSNDYWGWGLEDDDLLLRCVYKEMKIERRPGVFRSLPHLHADETDPAVQENRQRYRNFDGGEEEMWKSGLNTVRYKILSQNKSSDFVHYVIDVNVL